MSPTTGIAEADPKTEQPFRPCPACGSRDSDSEGLLTDRFFRVTAESFHYRRCRRCSSRFMDPVPSRGRVESYYPPSYWWGSETGRRNRLRFLLNRYRSLVVRDHLRYLKHVRQGRRSACSRLLDVGCGSGAFLLAAQSRGYEVTGLDVSSEAISTLTQLGIDGVVGTLKDNTLGDRRFDIITLFHVLEHLRDPRDEFESLLIHATERADIIVQVPNCQSFQARLLGRNWYGLDPPRHLTQFSSRGIRCLVTEMGLEILHTFHFSLRDNAPAFVSSLFPGLDPMVRRVRAAQIGKPESAVGDGLSSLLYLGLVLLATPAVLFESLLRRGGSTIIHARRP